LWQNAKEGEEEEQGEVEEQWEGEEEMEEEERLHPRKMYPSANGMILRLIHLSIHLSIHLRQDPCIRKSGGEKEDRKRKNTVSGGDTDEESSSRIFKEIFSKGLSLVAIGMRKDQVESLKKFSQKV